MNFFPSPAYKYIITFPHPSVYVADIKWTPIGFLNRFELRFNSDSVNSRYIQTKGNVHLQKKNKSLIKRWELKFRRQLQRFCATQISRLQFFFFEETERNILPLTCDLHRYLFLCWADHLPLNIFINFFLWHIFLISLISTSTFYLCLLSIFWKHLQLDDKRGKTAKKKWSPL